MPGESQETPSGSGRTALPLIPPDPFSGEIHVASSPPTPVNPLRKEETAKDGSQTVSKTEKPKPSMAREQTESEVNQEARRKKMIEKVKADVLPTPEGKEPVDREGAFLLQQIEQSLIDHPERFKQLGKLYKDLLDQQASKDSDPTAYLKTVNTLRTIRALVGTDVKDRPLPKIVEETALKSEALRSIHEGLDAEVAATSRDIALYVLDKEGYFLAKAEQAILLEDLQRDIVKDGVRRVDVRRMANRYRRKDKDTEDKEKGIIRKYIEVNGVEPHEIADEGSVIDQLNILIKERRDNYLSDEVIDPNFEIFGSDEKKQRRIKDAEGILKTSVDNIAGEFKEQVMVRIRDDENMHWRFAHHDIRHIEQERAGLVSSLGSSNIEEVIHFFDSLRANKFLLKSRQLEMEIDVAQKTIDVIEGKLENEVLSRETKRKLERRKRELERNQIPTFYKEIEKEGKQKNKDTSVDLSERFEILRDKMGELYQRVLKTPGVGDKWWAEKAESIAKRNIDPNREVRKARKEAEAENKKVDSEKRRDEKRWNAALNRRRRNLELVEGTEIIVGVLEKIVRERVAHTGKRIESFIDEERQAIESLRSSQVEVEEEGGLEAENGRSTTSDEMSTNKIKIRVADVQKRVAPILHSLSVLSKPVIKGLSNDENIEGKAARQRRKIIGYFEEVGEQADERYEEKYAEIEQKRMENPYFGKYTEMLLEEFTIAQPKKESQPAPTPETQQPKTEEEISPEKLLREGDYEGFEQRYSEQLIKESNIVLDEHDKIPELSFDDKDEALRWLAWADNVLHIFLRYRDDTDLAPNELLTRVDAVLADKENISRINLLREDLQIIAKERLAQLDGVKESIENKFPKNQND